MGRPARRRPRRVIFGVLGGLVAVAVVGVVAASAFGPQQEPQAESPAAPAASTASGCVAGTDITAAEVLAEQARQDLTVVGAAQFAGLYAQFAYQVPQVTAADRAEVRTAIARDAYDASLDELNDSFYASRYEGQSAFPSLADGRYVINDASTDQVTVSVLAIPTTADGNAVVVAGTARSLTVTFTLEPSDDGWTIVDGSPRSSADELAESGTLYTEGC